MIGHGRIEIALSVIAAIFHCNCDVLSPLKPSETSIILTKTNKPHENSNFGCFTSYDNNFEEFLAETEYVVDKSLFIKEILSCQKNILLISTPPAFGKTTNLGMLQLFFEHPVKDDIVLKREQSPGYGYFKYGRLKADNGQHQFSEKPLISRYDEILNEHLCNHPVIYLDFKPSDVIWYPEEIKLIERILCEKISREFKRHFYVRKYFIELIGNSKIDMDVKQQAKTDWQKFELYALNRQLSWPDLSTSLRFLCQVLYRFFNRKVVILIDEMDFLVNHVQERWIYKDEPCLKDQQNQVMGFLKDLINSTFHENDFLLKTIIMGNTLSCIDELFSLDELSIHVSDGIENDFAEFFGFTESISKKLLQISKVPDKVTAEAIECYNGYKFHSISNHSLLCPLDVISVMQKKSIPSTWVTKYLDDDLNQLIELEFMKSSMEVLMDGKSTEVAWSNVKFNRYDFIRIFNLINERIARPSCNDTSLVLKRLYAEGYVTLAGVGYDIEQNKTYYRVKVANRKMASLIENALVLYEEHFLKGK
ncbi:uncharacterized protein LOC135838957 [Planococcus citri]|uniref:uncharacterized protein LOC135838957 n=1 Tax=Planococcus citri TaxID=170843 RepID=UPI0031F83976